MSANERDVCAEKTPLLGEYRAAVARYSAALTDLSFASTLAIPREQFQAEWNRLEAVRIDVVRRRAEFVSHIEDHGC
jgi:hypothetical protein